jgi:hypothetical protein
MKVKVIKRSEQEKAKTAISVSISNQPKNADVRESMATIKSWVDDLRQKRENELLAAKIFREREFCS